MKILDGKLLSLELKEEISLRAKKLKREGITPALKVVLIGDHSASEIYVKHKKVFCEDVGIECQILRFSENVTEEELATKIIESNKDKKIHGIIVQLPIPNHISKSRVISLIAPEKDVDGFTASNLGHTFLRKEDALLPATPAGVIKLLDKYFLSVKGKSCVIIGHSRIVGKPLSMLLLSRDATISVCNVFTPDISRYTGEADFIFTAVGKVNLIKADMVKEGFVGVDIGISRNEDGKVCGDFDFENIKEKASYITPVPGGVGPMTVATLCENVVKAAESSKKYRPD